MFFNFLIGAIVVLFIGLAVYAIRETGRLKAMNDKMEADIEAARRAAKALADAPRGRADTLARLSDDSREL